MYASVWDTKGDLGVVNSDLKKTSLLTEYRTGKTSWQNDAFWRGNHVHDDSVNVHARFLQGGDWTSVCGVEH